MVAVGLLALIALGCDDDTRATRTVENEYGTDVLREPAGPNPQTKALQQSNSALGISRSTSGTRIAPPSTPTP